MFATERSGKKRWGAERWTSLKRRLAAMEGAPTLKDMDGVPGNCHPLSGDRAGQFAVSITGPFRLIFRPDHQPLPLSAAGGLDRAAVTRVMILEVADYHGD